MFPNLRIAARTAWTTATLVLAPVLGFGLGTASAEPWPHVSRPGPVATPPVALSDESEVLHCTVRPGHDGCVVFDPPDRGVVAAVLYAGPFFTGARVVVHLGTEREGCTPGSTDDQGGGDLVGPLRGFRGRVGSVQTFHRCDIRLHEAFLGTSGSTTRWMRQESSIPDDAGAAAFTLT